MHLEKEAKRVNNEHHDTRVLHSGRTTFIKVENLQLFVRKKNPIKNKSHRPLLDAVRCTWKKKPNQGNNEHHDTTVPHTGEQLKLVNF